MITRTHKLVCAIIFLVVSVLVFDNNCFIKKSVNVIINDKVIELSAGRKLGERGHKTFFLKDSNGNKYKVPVSYFEYYQAGDTLAVTRSFFFNKAIRIESQKNGEFVAEKIGVLNSDVFSVCLSIITLILCVIIMFFEGMLKTVERQIAVFLFAILLMAVIVAFYFIFST